MHFMHLQQLLPVSATAAVDQAPTVARPPTDIFAGGLPGASLVSKEELRANDTLYLANQKLLDNAVGLS